MFVKGFAFSVDDEIDVLASLLIPIIPLFFVPDIGLYLLLESPKVPLLGLDIHNLRFLFCDDVFLGLEDDAFKHCFLLRKDIGRHDFDYPLAVIVAR